MNLIRYVWTHPYPESIRRLFLPLIQPFTSGLEKRPLSNHSFRIRCIAVSLVTFFALVFLTKDANPLSYFIDIPIFDLASIQADANNNQFAPYIYLFSSSILAAICLWLIRNIIFHGMDESLLTINGFLFAIMSVFVTALMAIPSENFTLYLTNHFLSNIEGAGLASSIALGLILNFTLYFAIKDSFSAILSSAIAIMLIPFIQSFIPNYFITLLTISLLLMIIQEILDKTGLWDGFTAFCAKWFYTPKYFIRLGFWFIWVILLAMSWALSSKNHRED